VTTRIIVADNNALVRGGVLPFVVDGTAKAFGLPTMLSRS